MTSEFQSEKANWRARVRADIRKLTEAERREKARAAVERLAGQALWARAHSVLLYAPLPDELDVWPLLERGLEEGKRVALPRFEAVAQAYVACEVRQPGRDLCAGKFGVREPRQDCGQIPINLLDLVLAPGVAFDRHGVRLGRGKGYYDRLLTTVRGDICGVAFDEQIVESLPAESHDIHVTCILTPTRWIDL